MLKMVPEDFWLSQPIYQHPEFLLTVAPRTSWYAEFRSRSGTVYFPFTGQKWLGKWRLFQVPYCQKYRPFSVERNCDTAEFYPLWLQFLKEKAWTISWPLEGNPNLENLGNLIVEKKINQFVSLQPRGEEIIHNWKSGRKQALKKSEGLKTIELDDQSFSTFLNQILKQKSGPGWRPDRKETELLLSLSHHPYFQQHLFRYGVLDGKECLTLVLLVFWNKRFHYLFSTNTSKGFSGEALTRFFHDFFTGHASSPNLFDFEGSSLPGVHAFFASLGAEEEEYSLIRKNGFGLG